MVVRNRMPGYFIATLNGRLDGITHADCEEAIAPILVPSTKAILFDMTDLDYISSMGLRVILKTRKYIEKEGGSFHMINLQPQIEKIFEIANMLHGMKLFASVKEADDYFDAMQKKYSSVS
ncbi:STAS domain-containing protein [Syntrophus gentianae]|nr:STAS domain-containing protein [Syntrophus gentianae]